MRSVILGFSALAATTVVSTPSESQVSVPFPALTYADFADLTLPSPVVAHVRVTRVVRLKPKQAPNVAPGKSRFFVEADVVSLLKGAGGVPPAVTYLVDLPNGPGGKPIKIQKKSEFLVFASPVPGRPGELRLSAPDAHRIWSPAEGERVRQLIQESARPDAPPQISGIGRGFHVPGSLPGEGETQIFLQAADGRPISLNILRRPGERSRWAVALSEIVDDAAEPPVRDTLLWYRLACTLPPNLPPQSLADAEAAYHVMIRMDYQVVMQGLGPCARTRTR